MCSLSAPERYDRLRLDERTMALVNLDPAPITVTAHASTQDAWAGSNPIGVGTTDTPPVHYHVVYDFDTLKGPGISHRPTVVHIDLTANGNYPFNEPVSRVVGDVTPWTPHFHPVHPICIGETTWRKDGQTLAVDLVSHIAKLLNFDEPPPKPGYSGWNAQAIRWWTQEHKCQPLNPHLRYPVIDPNMALGRNGRRIVAAVARPASRVVPAGSSTASRVRSAGAPR